MKIKTALKFIFLHSPDIIRLEDDHYLPAIQLVTLYNVYLGSKNGEIYHSRLCQLCEQVEKVLKNE